jgi:hypothetical protein
MAPETYRQWEEFLRLAARVETVGFSALQIGFASPGSLVLGNEPILRVSPVVQRATPADVGRPHHELETPPEPVPDLDRR